MSKKNGEIYIGSTGDLKVRLRIHNRGGEISTRRYIPWELVYYEAYTTDLLARARESRLKQHGNAKRELKRRIGVLENGAKRDLPSTTFAEPFKSGVRRDLSSTTFAEPFKSGVKRDLSSTTFAEPFKSGAGFTVVELIVAMSIFAIFLGIAFGVFVQAVKGQRELTRFMAVQNNAGLVLEQMMREVRTGYWFCSQPDTGISPCENPGSASLTFINYEGEEVEYALDAGAVKRNGVSLTSGEVRVGRLQFLVTQQGNICVPPRITILMRVGLAGAGDVVPVNLETSVSSRVFPIDVRGAPESVRFGCEL